MLKVLQPIRLKLADKLSDSKNTTPRAISVKNEVDSLKALKKELDERIANYDSTIIVSYIE